MRYCFQANVWIRWALCSMQVYQRIGVFLKSITCNWRIETHSILSSSVKRICRVTGNSMLMMHPRIGWIERKSRGERIIRILGKQCRVSPRSSIYCFICLLLLAEQTALTGQVRTEINCLPVENDEYHRITNQRALLALRPKPKTRVMDDISSGNLLNPGTMGTTRDFSNFIVSHPLSCWD